MPLDEQKAREVVRPHLLAQERVEYVFHARVRTGRPGAAARFFGTAGRATSTVVLTDRRLLVLARGARPGRREWLDLQLARDRLHARPPETSGGLSWVPLESGLGSRVVMASTGRLPTLTRFAELVRGETRGRA